MKTPRVFRRNRFTLHPPSHSRCLCKPRRPSCVGRASLAVCCPELSFEHSIRALELPSLQPTPQHIHVKCHACTILQSTERTMIRLLAAVPSRKKPLFHSVQTDWRIQTLVLPNRNCFAVLLPAQIFLPMPTPKHFPFWEGPAPEEGTPRVSGEPSRRKGSAHSSPEGRGLRPPARGAPP